jgi:hypothetical protein
MQGTCLARTRHLRVEGVLPRARGWDGLGGGGLQHGELEEQVDVRGRELLRRPSEVVRVMTSLPSTKLPGYETSSLEACLQAEYRKDSIHGLSRLLHLHRLFTAGTTPTQALSRLPKSRHDHRCKATPLD